jgi:hypothetical protein
MCLHIDDYYWHDSKQQRNANKRIHDASQHPLNHTAAKSCLISTSCNLAMREITGGTNTSLKPRHGQIGSGNTWGDSVTLKLRRPSSGGVPAVKIGRGEVSDSVTLSESILRPGQVCGPACFSAVPQLRVFFV